MYKRRLSLQNGLMLCAMAIALIVLNLFAAAALPAGTVFFLFLAVVVLCVLTNENAYVFAFCAYVLGCAIGFWLAPEPMPVLIYALIGHYGIFRRFIEQKAQGKLFQCLWKLLYCDLFLGGAVIYAAYFTSMLASLVLPLPLPLWALGALSQLAILVFDQLYRLVELIYVSRIRHILLPRSY